MSATLKGGIDLSQLLASLPANLERNVLRGALKAGADVIAQGAREECRSAEVRATIGTTSKSEPGIVTAKVQTKGDGAYKAPWLEHGTDPHFISVDDEQTEGRTVSRINRLDRGARKDGRSGPGASLVIGGAFVGGTVFHPGAKPYPFMRPAADTRQDEAMAAIVAHVDAKLTKAGLTQPPADEPDE